MVQNGEQSVEEFYVTFGVQYTKNPEYGGPTRLGMHKDGYAVIEAPDEAIARAFAQAVFGDEWSRLYTAAEYDVDNRKYQPDGELLRIVWAVPS